MEENKKTKILILILILIIVVLTVILGVQGFKLTEKEDLSQIQEVVNVEDKKDSISKEKEFSEIMDTLYSSYNIENNNCYSFAEDCTYWVPHDNSGEVACSVEKYSGGISIYLNDTYMKKYVDIYSDITGIDGDVVFIEIVEYTDIAYPREIYFLTREGKVYCLDAESLGKKDFVAKKIEGLEKVIKIEKIGVPTEEHDAVAEVATTFEGEKILLSLNFSSVNLK